ncbi:MAG TPA: hypothetical protein VNZ49_04115 [Bacteroidia bacterium]|jgi:hypothetical protein|nr:hypothetical protein [Bacteroidia bacterium]
MKKFFSLFLLFLSSVAFAQDNNSTFYYKAKFEGVNTSEKATEVMSIMKTVFKTNSTYNESTGDIEFSSKMSINQTGFSRLMSGEGYQVESFEKTEVKEEIKTATTPPLVKKDSVVTTTGAQKKSGK